MALAVCPNPTSAARSRVDAGALESTVILSAADTPVPDAGCRRAVACPGHTEATSERASGIF
jgi:hypothetical protein